MTCFYSFMIPAGCHRESLKLCTSWTFLTFQSETVLPLCCVIDFYFYKNHLDFTSLKNIWCDDLGVDKLIETPYNRVSVNLSRVRTSVHFPLSQSISHANRNYNHCSIFHPWVESFKTFTCCVVVCRLKELWISPQLRWVLQDDQVRLCAPRITHSVINIKSNSWNMCQDDFFKIHNII